MGYENYDCIDNRKQMKQVWLCAVVIAVVVLTGCTLFSIF